MRRGHFRPVFARDTRSIRRGDRRDAVLCALSRRVWTHRDYSRKMPRTANEPSPFSTSRAGLETPANQQTTFTIRTSGSDIA